MHLLRTMASRKAGIAAKNDADVIVVGAGAAGLTAAAELAKAGYSVIIIEARNRVGGRMFTKHDPSVDYPIELGAEFIHGRPPEIWDTLRKHKIRTTEVDGDNWCVRKGKIHTCDFFEEVDEILKRMNVRGRDESFQSFLDRCCKDASAETKEHAVGYVSGFNAADPAKVSVHWLVQQMRAEEKIDGERAFRPRGGYTALVDILLKRVKKRKVPIQLNTVVERISWQEGAVTVDGKKIDGKKSGKTLTLTARQLLLTVPLGVLQAPPGQTGSIEFQPPLPNQKLTALSGLEMGKVIRVVFTFRKRFWSQIVPGNGKKNLAGMSFLFSHDEFFPTWWTTMPKRLPVITGWAPFQSAERVVAGNTSVADKSLRALSKLLNIEQKRLEKLLKKVYFHDWQSDPFSRGAYSYAKAGAVNAPEILGRPLKNTLFFAGEATDTTGNNGTVHGAIASGQRAAREIRRVKKPARARRRAK
ncbi:MAG TPA: NAD(P)/FAD-dependent oxidoreductase [Candidatus Sulfotelmatobacter sp.]